MQNIWIMGAGAVGGYMAAHLARAGHAVSVIDPWAANVEAIRTTGLVVDDLDGRSSTRLKATTPGEPPPAGLPDTVVLACKIGQLSKDLDWLEGTARYRGFYIATLNSLADADVARRVGSERVLSCIVSGLHGELTGPGHIARKAKRFGSSAVFRFGEVEKGMSERARFWSDICSAVDTSVAVENLRAERWTKLLYNGMTCALCAVAQIPVREMCFDPVWRSRMIDLGLEIVTVAEAKGIALGKVCDIEPDLWRRAAHSDANARRLVEDGIKTFGVSMEKTARSGAAQDRARGRASEVDAINGAIVREAEMLGRDAPVNRALRDELIGIERAAGWR